jgi:hypothetical protein
MLLLVFLGEQPNNELLYNMTTNRGKDLETLFQLEQRFFVCYHARVKQFEIDSESLEEDRIWFNQLSYCMEN